MASPYDNGGTAAFPVGHQTTDSPDLSDACNALFYSSGGTVDPSYPWPGEGGTAFLDEANVDSPDAILLVNYLGQANLNGFQAAPSISDPVGGSAYPSPQTTDNPDGVIAAGFLYDYL